MSTNPRQDNILRLVINLDRSPKRLELITKQLSALGLSFERVAAIDGRKMKPEALERFEAPYDDPRKCIFRYALQPTEIACFLSHAACWQRLVESDAEWGLVMEDDVAISPRFKQFAASSDWIPEGVRIAQLHGYPQSSFTVAERYPVRDTELLRIVWPTPNGCLAYLIHREAAAWALANYRPMPSPVDDWMFTPYSDFAKLFPPHRLLAACVTTRDDIPSDIGNRVQRRPQPTSTKVRVLRRLKKCGYRFEALFQKKRRAVLTYE